MFGRVTAMDLFRRAIEIAKNEGLGSLIRKAYRYTLLRIDQKVGFPSLIMVPYATLKFNSMSHWTTVLDYVFSDNVVSLLIRPMQIQEEVAQLLGILDSIKPRIILEIGTAHGGTLFLWTRIATEDALLISIDLPGGLFGGGYPRLKAILYKRFAMSRQKIALLRADSHDLGTLKKVEQLIGDNGIDFLFIDGDHSYEGVKKDYEMYSPLVKSGGIIAFHDIVPGPTECVGGVPRFWSELKRSLPKEKYVEIVNDWSQGGYGIGVVFK